MTDRYRFKKQNKTKQKGETAIARYNVTYTICIMKTNREIRSI